MIPRVPTPLLRSLNLLGRVSCLLDRHVKLYIAMPDPVECGPLTIPMPCVPAVLLLTLESVVVLCQQVWVGFVASRELSGCLPSSGAVYRRPFAIGRRWWRNEMDLTSWTPGLCASEASWVAIPGTHTRLASSFLTLVEPV